MERPDIKKFLHTNGNDIDYKMYASALDQFITESQNINNEELREKIKEILRTGFALHVTEKKVTQILSLIPKPVIKFPSEEIINATFATEGNVVMRDGMSYHDICLSNKDRKYGANWMKEMVKELNRIS